MHAAGNDDLGLRLGALAAAWLAGVGLQLQRAELASLLPLALLGGGAALSLLIAWRRRLLWLALAALAIGGVATAVLRALARLSDALAPGLEGVEQVVIGPEAVETKSRPLFIYSEREDETKSASA